MDSSLGTDTNDCGCYNFYFHSSLIPILIHCATTATKKLPYHVRAIMPTGLGDKTGEGSLFWDSHSRRNQIIGTSFQESGQCLWFCNWTDRSEDDPLSAQGTGRSSTGAFWEAHKVSRLWGQNRIWELGSSLGTGGGSRSNLNNAEMGTKCRGNS